MGGRGPLRVLKVHLLGEDDYPFCKAQRGVYSALQVVLDPSKVTCHRCLVYFHKKPRDTYKTAVKENIGTPLPPQGEIKIHLNGLNERDALCNTPSGAYAGFKTTEDLRKVTCIRCLNISGSQKVLEEPKSHIKKKGGILRLPLPVGRNW